MVHGVRTRVVAWTIVLRQSVTEDYLFELREQFNGDGSDDDGADGKRRYLGLRVSCGRFEPSTLIPAHTVGVTGEGGNTGSNLHGKGEARAHGHHVHTST